MNTIYESIVEDTNFVIFVVQDGYIVYVNERLQERTGFARSELVGAAKTTLIAADAGPPVDPPHNERVADDFTPNQCVELESKTGGQIPVERSVSRIEYEGKPAVVSFCREITEQQVHERALQERKLEYETVFENAQDALFLLDIDADGTIRFQRFNERWTTVTGNSTDDIRGKTPTEVFGDDLGAELETTYRTCYERKETLLYEDTHQFTAEQTVWQTKLTPIIVDGEVEQIIGSAREITTQKERERTLERRQAFLENTSDLITLLDEEGIVQYQNHCKEHLPKPDTGDIVGEVLADSIHPDDVSLAVATFEAVLEEPGETASNEARMKATNGEWRWYENRIVNLLDDPAVEGLIVSSRDITERKRQEIYLEKAQAVGNLGWWRKEIPSDQIYWSDRVYDMWDVKAESGFIDHERFLECIHPDDTTRVEQAWEDALEGAPYDVEHRIVTGEGHTRWMRQQAELVFEDGKPVSAIGVVRDITAQKQREVELTNLRDQFKRFSENVQDAFFLLSADYSETLYVNAAVEEIYGITTDDAYADPEAWLQHVHPDDKDELIAAVDEYRAGRVEGTLSQQCRIQHPERGLRWVQARIDVVTDGDGTVTQIAGIASDITERKEREQKLRQFREAVEETAHAIYITEPDGTIEYVNPAFEEITGYSKDEAIGRTPRILRSGEYESDYYEAFWETVDAGERWVDEIIDERADGDQIVLNQTVSPITDENGVPRKLVAVAQDITQRKEYEAALEKAREELRQIIDLVPDLLFAKNRAGQYLLANEATAEIYGMTPAELEGMVESDVIPDVDERAEFRKDDIEVLDSGESKEIPEETFTTIDGETRVFQTTKIPYEVPGSGEDAVLGYARDVTALKEYEQQLETQRDNLEVLNQVVRHDIRNDLQLVLGYAEVVKGYVEEGGEEYVTQVLEAARDAVDITTTARDVTEVMLQSAVDCAPVRLRPVLEDEVDDIRSQQEHAVVTIDGAIPNVTVPADDMLESVFRNLLTNAIQHNDKEVPAVTVSARHDADSVLVQIADNGPGIPDERKETIFEQGELGLDSGGTGIGLYLVDTLVGRYGGDVHVEDNTPEGTTFIVELPIGE